MKSIIIDEYEAKPPDVHPANPNLVMFAFEVPGSEETYVFPMSLESAEEYYERLGKTLGKMKAPRIHLPTDGDIRAARR